MSNTSPPLTSQTEDQFREPPDRRTSAHGPEWIDWWTYDSFEDAWNWVDGLPPGYEYKTREQIIAERLAAFEEHLGDAAHDLGQQILRFLDTLQEGGEGEEYATAESFTNFGADAPSGDVGAASGVNGVWIDTMDQVSPQEFVVTSTYKLLPPMRLDPVPISSSGHVSSQFDDMSEEDRAGIERMKEIVDVAKPLDTSDRDMLTGGRELGTIPGVIEDAIAAAQVELQWVLPGTPSRIDYGPESFGSRAARRLPATQRAIHEFYLNAWNDALDGVERPYSESGYRVSGAKNTIPEDPYTALGVWLGGYQIEFLPDYERELLNVNIYNVTSIDSGAGHRGKISTIPTLIVTNAPFGGEPAFGHDWSEGNWQRDVNKEVRPSGFWGLLQPFGNVAQIYHIVLPLESERIFGRDPPID